MAADPVTTVAAATADGPGAAPSPAAGRSSARGGHRPLWTRPGVLLALAFLALVLVAVAWPGAFTSHSPTDTDPVVSLQAPSGDHLFGTDQLGRDLFSRIVHGARHSVWIAVGATAIALVAALVLGSLAGLGGRLVDRVMVRLLDVMLSFPALLLALVVVTVVGRGETSVLVAIGIANTPGYARLLRARLLVVRRSEYVEAATALGVSRWTSTWRHILPNSIGPLLVMATLGLGTAMIFASGLSFLGVGAQPPTPEWGAMLAEGRSSLSIAWWAGVFPGCAITATAVAITVIGRYLRQSWGVGPARPS